MWRVQKQTLASSPHRVKVTLRHSYHNNVIEATNEGNSSGAPTESKSYHIFPPDNALQDPHNVAPRNCRERETVALYTELGNRSRLSSHLLGLAMSTSACFQERHPAQQDDFPSCATIIF